jgi:hypothetical protein
VSSVRRSKWPLAALALALVALLGAEGRGQDAGLADLQMRASDDPSLPALEPPSDAAEDAATPAKPNTPPKPKPADLPPLRPYAGAQRLGLRGGAPDPNLDPKGLPLDIHPPGPTIAVPEPPPKRRKAPDDSDPFAPVGLRVGDVDVKPYLEQDIGYATNPLSAPSGGKGSMFETTEAGVGWQSVGGRNDFHGELKGGYNDYFATPEASGAYGSGTVDEKIEATRDLVFDDEGRFNTAPQSLSNFGVTPTASGTNPYVAVSTFGGTFGATQALGKLSLGLHGTYDRESYQNVALGAGGPGLAADDYNDWGLKFRAAYRITEAFSPFVEFGADTRAYDSGTDALGYRRDSNGVTGMAGATLAFSQQLTGEASAGYGERNYQDSRLEHADAPLVDASLIWSVTPLTTLTLKAQSLLNDSILAGASADINRTYTIDVTHALTRAIILGLTGSYGTDDFVGVAERDVNASFGATAEYHIDRDVVLKASATHQIYLSNLPNQGSVGDVFLMGIRLQR